MGYSRDHRNRLCCDHCGTAGNVRKRTCPYRILTAEGRTVVYCYPPALCGACYATHGGLRGVHGERCRDGAAREQTREDSIRARLTAGEVKVRAAFGSWHESVPDGSVMVSGSDGRHYLIDDVEYAARKNDPFVNDFPSATLAEVTAC